MTQTTQLILLNITWPIITIFAVIYFVNRDKLKRSGKELLERRRKIHNRYVFLYNNVFTRKRFRRIVEQYSTLACYNKDLVKEKSVTLFTRSLAIAISMPVLALIFLKDVIFAILTALVGYIYYDITVDKEIDKVYTEIIKEISMCIASIRERYMECENIPTAILLSDKGKHLEQPIKQLYDMLTDVEPEERLHEFCRTSPIRLLKTLAITCYIVNENGDSRKPGGMSCFSEELTTLRQEADTEIRRLTKTKIAFKSLPLVTLIGLACTPIADGFLLGQIPGTALLVKGLYGSIEKALLIVATIVIYYIISILNKPSVVNQVDKVLIIDNLCSKKKVRDWLANIIPKAYKKRYKLDLLMKDSISSKNLNYIYLSKVIYSVSLFIITLIVLMCFVFTARSALWNNHTSLSFIPDTIVMTEKMKMQLTELDEYYMTQPRKLSEEETLAIVKGRLRGLNELDYTSQVDRLSKKWDKYYALSFKWYFVLIAYGAAIIGWYIPNISLMLRRMLVQYESSEDVMQLQTLAIVLSNTKMDVLKALYWLEKQSTIHKAPLRFAYHEYTSDPELALDRLFSSVANKDFKRLVSKLKSAVYNVSLEDAFSDMVLDKEQSLRLREMLQDEALESKKQWAKLLASAPLMIMLVGGFVGPILILGLTDLMKMLGTLQGM